MISIYSMISIYAALLTGCQALRSALRSGGRRRIAPGAEAAAEAPPGLLQMGQINDRRCF